ncbi:MAG: site-2 protease family protein [Thermoleophilaceae bacterium]
MEYYTPPPPPTEAQIAPPLEPPRKTLRNRISGALAALAVLLGKFKGVLLLLPKLKILTTSGSMLVSVAAYALIWGWKFAFGFVILLFVHEMGHVLQLRREGVKASAPLFIPFLGAVVGMKELPNDAAAEARVGLAGPVLGSVGALVPLLLWRLTGDVFWEALAFVGFFLNLFNLLPVLPLDGGRAMAALTPWMWIVGYALLIAATVIFPSPIMLLILLFGGLETLRRWRARKSPAAQRYHRVSGRQRAAIAGVYLGLAIALAIGMDVTHVVRTFSDV